MLVNTKRNIQSQINTLNRQETMSTAKDFLNCSHTTDKYLIMGCSLNQWRCIWLGKVLTALILNISANLKYVCRTFKLVRLLYNIVLIKMPCYSRYDQLFWHNRRMPTYSIRILLICFLSFGTIISSYVRSPFSKLYKNMLLHAWCSTSNNQLSPFMILKNNCRDDQSIKVAITHQY